MPLLQRAQHVNTEDMKPRDPLVTFNVLGDPPLTLVSEILPDTSGSISQKVVRVFQRSQRGGEEGLVRVGRWRSRGIEDVME